jgi:hypothetical protein
MNSIQSAKPDSFGKKKKGGSGGGGKKKSNKNAAFYLKAYLTSTQQKGSVNIDLKTIDVSSIIIVTSIVYDDTVLTVICNDIDVY